MSTPATLAVNRCVRTLGRLAPVLLMVTPAIGVCTAAAASCPLSTAVAPYASTALDRWEVKIADGGPADLDGGVDGGCDTTVRVCLGETGRCHAEHVASVQVAGPRRSGVAAQLRAALAALPIATPGDGAAVQLDDTAAAADTCVEARVRADSGRRVPLRLAANPRDARRVRVRVAVRCLPADVAEHAACTASRDRCPPRAGDGEPVERAADDVTPFATASASSAQHEASAASGAIDGVVPAAPGDPRREWISRGELGGASVRLTWPQPVALDRIVLSDRPSGLENVRSATLLADTGDSVPVGALPSDGRAVAVPLGGRTLQSLTFLVTQAEGRAAGLAEITAFGVVATPGGGGTDTPGGGGSDTPGGGGSDTPGSGGGSDTPGGAGVHAVAIPTHPRVYLTRDGVARIRAVVAAGAEPWKTAFDALVERAAAALRTRARSVTTEGQNPGSHDYRTDAPYTRSDGVVDPASDRADYQAAMAVSSAVRDLGLAYAVTGDGRYADKALQLLRTWALAPETRMNPRFTNGQSHIELSITMPALFYGADLVWDHAGWTADERAAFESWVTAFLASARTWSAAQNFENWRHVFLATAAAFLDDVPSLDYTFERFRSVVEDQMSTDGTMVRETGRTRSLFYSTYAVNAMTQTAEIARLHGVDLWSWTTPGGKGLEKALDFHAPYVVAPSTWPHQQITAYVGENAAIYELAHARWGKPAHLEAIRRWGRPMTEERVMGAVTLTHGGGLQAGHATAAGEQSPAP